MKMRLPLSLLLVLGLQTINAAQQRQLSLPVEEALAALHLSYNTPVDLSPDGKWVAYTLQDDRRKEKPEEGYGSVDFTSTGVKRGSLGCDIWVADTETGQAKNLTGGVGSNWSPVWSRDGNRLAFYSDRDGTARLWVSEHESGNLRRVSAETVRPFSAFETVRWSPDGRKILVKVLPEGMTIEGVRDAILSPPQTEKQTANISTALVYRSSVSRKTATEDAFYLIPRRADLALIEATTGKVQRIATGFNPAWYDFSPDGGSVAFVSTKGFETLNTRHWVYDLSVVSLSDARPRVIARDIELDFTGMTVSWSPDGKMLSYITSRSGDCFVVSVGGGNTPRNLSPAPHPYFSNGHRAPLWDSTGKNIYLLAADSVWKASVRENKAEEVAKIPDRKIVESVAPREGGRLWSPDGGRSVIIITRDDRTKQEGFYRIDLTTRKYVRLLETNKSYGFRPIHKIDVSGDGNRMIFIAEDAGHNAEIFITNTDFKSPKRVTRINPQFDKYATGASRVIEWHGLEGETLRGALLLPPGYQEGKRYPLIVKIYPGANLSDNANNFGLDFNGAGVENMQLFATRGYAVLLPDSPSPKGRAMQGVAKTVLPGVAKAVELGIADPERLGVIGHSNGGYGVLSLLVQTARFKAAVCRGGYGNRIGLYGFMRRDGSSWGVAFLEETIMGGPPWQFPNKYIEDSPVFYLDRVQTPLLLVHGAEDSAAPAFLADEIFVWLRRLGREVEYAKYEGEEHWEGTWDYANQVDYLNRIINWFDKHLKR